MLTQERKDSDWFGGASRSPIYRASVFPMEYHAGYCIRRR
jgi:hypothetical protein